MLVDTAINPAGESPMDSLRAILSSTDRPYVVGRPSDVWNDHSIFSATHYLIASAKPTSGAVNSINLVQAKSNAVARLLYFQRLKDGWNGRDAVGPSFDMVSRAFEFLAAIPSGIPEPRPMLSSSGEIAFYWETPKGYVESGFDADGSWYYLSHRTAASIAGVQDAFNGTLPAVLTEAIASLTA